MDPLTAFGLASNGLSFVSFASELIKASVEVYRSGPDHPGAALCMEQVYGDLKGLNNKLILTCEHRITDEEAIPSGREDDVKDSAIAVKKLAETCRRDCNELLRVTDKLQLEDGGSSRRKWKSFRIALRKLWTQKAIDDIEDRLLKTQMTLTLHICVISGNYHKRQNALQHRLQKRSVELQLNQNEGLLEVKRSLAELEEMLREVHGAKEPNSIATIDIESLDRQFKRLSTTQILLEKEQKFLSTLQYDARPLRHDAIPQAHEQTFRWLLDDEAGQYDSLADQDSPTLAQWLESGSGIFWVTGKPGSGKSTLMKFIAGAPMTYERVSRWASPTVVAAHYFWNSGSPMQKSQQGLLRSLLYDIFRQRPTLIPIVCEERWRELDNPGFSGRTWSLHSLNEALRKITENDADGEVNFCLFIDGLDEFEGDYDDHFQLCRTMCDLSASRHVKICLSSRPWNVFEEAFGSMPKIYIHDLTRNDIRNYAASRLQEHPKWAEICASTPFGGEWFIEEIAERCSGVFLWVFLVTKLLREGMTNRDRFHDLRRRLESVPRELGDFFKQILDSVEPLYHAKMATMLQIALVAKEPLSMVIYDFHDLEHDDEDYWQQSPMLPFTQGEYDEIHCRMAYHLSSRTRGLLELQSFQVNFIHRTVKDYLSTKPLLGTLKQKLPDYLGRKFVPELSILRAYAAWVQRATPEVLTRGSWAVYWRSATQAILDGVTPGIPELTKQMMPYAAQLDLQRPRDSRLKFILDGMDFSIKTMLSNARISANIINQWAWNTKLFFREHLVEWGVCNYVFGKEREDPVCSSMPWRAELYRKRLKAAIGRLQVNQKSFTGIGTVVSRVSPMKHQKGGASYPTDTRGEKRGRPKTKLDSQARSPKKRR